MSHSIVVIAEEQTEIETEQSLQEDGVEEMTSEATGKETTIIITLEKDYVNHSLEVNGEVTGFSAGEYEVVFTVYDGEDEKLTDAVTFVNEEWKWTHILVLDELDEGDYELLASMDDIESDPVFFTVDKTPPKVTINKPLQQFINESVIEGTIDEEVVSIDLFLYDSDEKIVMEFKIEPSGEFPFEFSNEDLSFVIDELEVDQEYEFIIYLYIEEGEYDFLITATDLAGNESEVMTVVTEVDPIEVEKISFIYDTTRPFIPPASLFPTPNMSQVSIVSETEEELTISAKIVDNNDFLEDHFEAFENAIVVYKNGEAIDGIVEFEKVDEVSNEVIITFTAIDPEAWEYNQKYYVFISPFLADNAGNLIHPRNWSFTTVTNTTVQSPHGNYLNNTNTCKTCHNVHTAPRPRLEGPNLELVDELEHEGFENENLHDIVNGYCMACHDGTVASPMLDHFSEGVKSDHNKQLMNSDGVVVSQSCGNCHDVHIASHPDNPNLLRDHITFQHDLEKIDSDVGFYREDGFVDSSQQLCETCHDSNFFDVVFDENGELVEGVEYKLFSYFDRNSSLEDPLERFGRSEDYLLCLRCHNEYYSENYNATDIRSYYEDDNSGHFIFARDGSQLEGHIPCADCHATHSSPNLSLIKDRLGHNRSGLDPEGYGVFDNLSRFNMEGEDEELTWTVEYQRNFCLTCHNNETELYGITVPLNKEVDGHKDSNTQSCASCHGGQSNSFIEAAHAPIRIINDE